ncbi:hypothetical protein NW768_004478 [Fusarium equiseti]|uniref:Uncharacterized protein n=1 Tax=Fusarium equiseti TaxID=61235 RepID=A0ABQ8RGD7_FUSEQ|nr:hypothetical protein NW768_004478 [Fusarium equiseti]
MPPSYHSNKATHGSSNGPHSPRPDSDPTVTGAGRRDDTAVQDMRTHGNAQPPANSADLAREIELMWNEGAKLPAQLPRPS